jgi:hypothetical protein
MLGGQLGHSLFVTVFKNQMGRAKKLMIILPKGFIFKEEINSKLKPLKISGQL